jgi:hypothetical protein
MRTAMVIVIAPGRDGCPGLGEAQEDMLVKALVAQRLLNDSANAFCTGLPGAMQCQSSRPIDQAVPPRRLARSRYR